MNYKSACSKNCGLKLWGKLCQSRYQNHNFASMIFTIHHFRDGGGPGFRYHFKLPIFCTFTAGKVGICCVLRRRALINDVSRSPSCTKTHTNRLCCICWLYMSIHVSHECEAFDTYVYTKEIKICVLMRCFNKNRGVYLRNRCFAFGEWWFQI